MDYKAPLINSKDRRAFIGKKVVITGLVTQLDKKIMIIEATDRDYVAVRLREKWKGGSAFMEVVGEALRAPTRGSSILERLFAFQGGYCWATRPEAADREYVTVCLLKKWEGGYAFVDVVGEVQEDCSIREFKTTILGNSFDLDLANKVIEFSKRCPEMFE